ncbi:MULTISPECIES: type II secretion system protein GspM [unclassified Pseudomonas]|uniref:type II secretion system protein GspM n=1 Tax=unclassified Pseudomonas TaxID=196821 RepID=UPI002447F9E6|nr:MULTISPECIES: type II secretion system protein GspM [unclassified Pseudomonas]MDH0300864.1 type II secretion system protein M [Pseudomonas sp. GD04091]MDH1985227.1 type II secretion system protein M [Pseudomonas sp. GD03689]
MSIKANLGAARQRWRALAPRERRAVGAAGALLAVLFGWQVLIAPALARIEHWQAETPRLRSQAQTLDTLLAPRLAARPTDLDEALQRSLDDAGLQAHSRLRVEGEARWLSWQQAPAEAAMAWLQRVPPRLGLSIGRLDLRRDPDAESASPVTFSGTLRMDQAPGAKDPS